MAASILSRDNVPPVVGALGRFGFGSLGLLAMLAAQGSWPRPDGRLWLRLAAMGFFGVFLYNISFFTGLKTVPSGRASLMASLQPSVVFLFSMLVWGEKATWRKVAGLALSLAGAAVVLTQGEPARLFTRGIGTGDGWILLTVVAWVSYTLIGRGVSAKMETLAATAYGTWLGTGMLAVYALVSGMGPVDLGRPSFWILSAYLGLAGTTLAFVFYLRGIAELGAARASIFINLVPVFSVLSSALYLGEAVTVATMLGGAMALGGVALLNR
jgi:drug/metabolite transporter (DMT)-like permease